MTKYNPLIIEQKWQKFWDINKTFSAKIDKMIINLIEANKSSVRDYGKIWERTKSA